jgi:hypothetical protein
MGTHVALVLLVVELHSALYYKKAQSISTSLALPAVAGFFAYVVAGEFNVQTVSSSLAFPFLIR